MVLTTCQPAWGYARSFIFFFTSTSCVMCMGLHKMFFYIDNLWDVYGVTEKGVTKKIERLKCKLSGGTSIYEHKRIRAGPRKTSGRVSSNTTVNFSLFGTGTRDKRDSHVKKERVWFTETWKIGQSLRIQIKFQTKNFCLNFWNFVDIKKHRTQRYDKTQVV
jgi:hypothetical protein